jgi:hypothetical protein
VLGWAWSLLNPISQMLIFSVIFTYVFGQNPLAGDPSGLKNFPLYFLCGLLPWNFFAITTSTAMGNVQNGAGLIKKVTFPHEHLVFSVVVAQFVTLLIETIILPSRCCRPTPLVWADAGVLRLWALSPPVRPCAQCNKRVLPTCSTSGARLAALFCHAGHYFIPLIKPMPGRRYGPPLHRRLPTFVRRAHAHSPCGYLLAPSVGGRRRIFGASPRFAEQM